jgi:hypothetical protein
MERGCFRCAKVKPQKYQNYQQLTLKLRQIVSNKFSNNKG